MLFVVYSFWGKIRTSYSMRLGRRIKCCSIGAKILVEISFKVTAISNFLKFYIRT